MAGNRDIQWYFSQVKKAQDYDVDEADISCVEFNHNGDLLAAGDTGGQVVIYRRDPTSKYCISRQGIYNLYTNFQSHKPEFDIMKSLRITEKINQIKWLKRVNEAHFLLSTNDGTIKLWKVSEKNKHVERFNTLKKNGQRKNLSRITSLKLPLVKPSKLIVQASPKRAFPKGHDYDINSISLNSDQESFLSADDLSINLWHLEKSEHALNVVDFKPTRRDQFTELITAAEFHPQACNLFVYSSSKGVIRLCDMRAAVSCDRHSKLFGESGYSLNKSFMSELISGISDVKISNSGRYMMSRDYFSIKVWDLNMEAKPVEKYPVQKYMRSKMCSLYESDCLFDKFECCWSWNDRYFMTGSYNNYFSTFDRATKRDVIMEAQEITRPRMVLKPKKVCSGIKRKLDAVHVNWLNTKEKSLHVAWHPAENIIAVASNTNLFLFNDFSSHPRLQPQPAFCF